jgi:hypothetical protein
MLDSTLRCHSIAEFGGMLHTAIGLLLLTMVNRLNHIVDRLRSLSAEKATKPLPAQDGVVSQLAILRRRALIIRRAIVLAATSALSAAVLIASLFLLILFDIDALRYVSFLFVAAMLSLIASLICFIADINQSLHALDLELGKG